MTEAQEKNHTDRVDPSPRVPRGQLMRRAVTYTHQAGEGGTNAPLPSRKKSHYFWVPPRISDEMQHYTVYLFLENCSTSFGWYFHPSSGAHKLYLQYLVLVKPLLLPAAIVKELELV